MTAELLHLPELQAAGSRPCTSGFIYAAFPAPGVPGLTWDEEEVMSE
jgi:hypothetical protein